jgi:uncharacterized protein (TIGR03067 family)
MSTSIHWRAVGLFAFATLCLGLSIQAGGAQNKEQGDKADKELALIQGSWQVISFTENGDKKDESETANVQLVIKGNALTLVGMGDDKHGTIKIDSSKKPKQLDIFPEGGGPEKIACIYELTADTLKVCGAADGPRPTEFKSEAGSEIVLVQFKRADTKKAKVQGTFARIFSISEDVKARMVCVRMLPRMSAASNTPAAVSSSGASKTQTWS